MSKSPDGKSTKTNGGPPLTGDANNNSDGTNNINQLSGNANDVDRDNNTVNQLITSVNRIDPGVSDYTDALVSDNSNFNTTRNNNENARVRQVDQRETESTVENTVIENSKNIQSGDSIRNKVVPYRKNLSEIPQGTSEKTTHNIVCAS